MRFCFSCKVYKPKCYYKYYEYICFDCRSTKKNEVIKLASSFIYLGDQVETTFYSNKHKRNITIAGEVVNILNKSLIVKVVNEEGEFDINLPRKVWKLTNQTAEVS